MEDVSPKLRKQIEEAFDKEYRASKKIGKTLISMKNGDLTYEDANEFTANAGEALSKALQSVITTDSLPNGKFYWNIGKNAVEPNFRRVHDLCTAFTAQVQKAVNKAAGVSMMAIKPKFNQDRMNGLINKLCSYENFDDAKWIMGSPTVNFCQSICEDSIKENAEMQYKTGLKAVVVRIAEPKCCEWCTSLEGEYEYPDVPDEVYQRHENCRCTVIYKPDKDASNFQDVWSKQWDDQELRERIDAYNNTIDASNFNGNNIDRQSVIDGTQKLRQAMSPKDYDEYINHIVDNPNSDIARIYNQYADGLNSFTLVSPDQKCYYSPANYIYASLNPENEQRDGMSKFSTIAHEYGHYFDHHIPTDFLHFSEIDTINDTLAFGGRGLLRTIASSSDEFLAAVRKDRDTLLSLLRDEKSSFVSDLLKQSGGSSGVQDAIDGLFVKSRIAWGHGEKYYNRLYNNIKSCNRHKQLQKAYKDLGFDAGSQAKTKARCRQYEAASEMWANIMSAEVNGGPELEYVKKYLPNSYQMMKDILKEV